jgi:inorganic pyrophosphatase
VYGLPRQTTSKSYLDRTAATYDFTSDLTGKHPWPKTQTVEDIIQHGYLAIPKSEPETALISDKKDISKIGLSDLISQIRNRYQIYEKNMYHLEMAKCYTVSSQLAVESSRGGVAMNSKEAYSLTKKIGEFYQQQNEERVKLWQDLSRLKQILPEQAQNYLSSYRKLSMLDDIKGDELWSAEPRNCAGN